MACDNKELWRPPEESQLKLDLSILSSQPHTCILSSKTSQKPSPPKYADAQAYPSRVSQFVGKSCHQCPPAKSFPRTDCDQPGPSRQGQRDSDSTAYYCELCRVSCAGKISFKCHLAGKKHKKMEHSKRSTEEECNPKATICAVCHVKCSGLEAYNSHLRGKQHAKTVKLLKSRGCEIADVQPQSSSSQLSMPFSKIDPENYIEEFYSGKTKQFSCLVCNCICTNSRLKEAHLAGKKHQTALRKLKEALETATIKNRSESNPEPEIPTEHTSHAQPESSSHSPSTERPQIPPTGFARPSGPCMVASSDLQTLISLPPHLLADERYMQTKLKHILPSKEENDLMVLAVDAVCSALRQIHGVESNGVEDLLTSDELSGVYLVGPVAIGLQLRGQLIADVVLVVRHPLLPNCANKTRMELEGMLKKALSEHPDKTALLNVARLVRYLIRDSRPVPWGEFPDYVLLVLLGHLSFMDLSLASANRSFPPRVRPGLLFRRLLESLASGILIGRDGELSSMSDRPGSDLLLLDQMKSSDRISTTSAAQEALRLVAFRQINKIACVNHRITLVNEKETQLIAEISPNLSSLHPSTSTAPESFKTSSSSSDPPVARVRISFASLSGSSDPEKEENHANLPDQLTNLRRTAWLQLLDLPRFVPPCLTHYQPKNGVKSPSTALKTHKSLASLGKRKMNDNEDALNGSSCGESGGCGGDVPFLDDQLISVNVVKLDERNHAFLNDKRLVCDDSIVKEDVESNQGLKVDS
nr:zinc finger rna binding protein [Hymenolepis microstoma]